MSEMEMTEREVDMAKLVGECQRAERADCIDEQRLRAVERVDVAGAVGRFCPPGGLYRPA